MRLVDRIGPGHIGLNYMWLPTWIGMNTALIKDIEAHLSTTLLGQALTEEVLESAHDEVIRYLAKRFPQGGLFEYLDGLKFVESNETKTQIEGG